MKLSHGLGREAKRSYRSTFLNLNLNHRVPNKKKRLKQVLREAIGAQEGRCWHIGRTKKVEEFEFEEFLPSRS